MIFNKNIQYQRKEGTNMKRILFATLICAVLAGCHGEPFKIKTAIPETKDYKVLGEVEGSSGGFLLLGCIPIAKNDMISRAFEEAMLSKGADYLLSPTVEERWYWTPVGNGFALTVKGTAVKTIKP